jgi:hypothetical protein
MKGLKINVKAAQSIKFNKENEIETNININERYIFSKIFDKIYISSYRLASDINFLNKYKITHIINCAFASNSIQIINREQIKYLNLLLKDDPGYDFIYEIFSSINFIENALKIQGNILIHCHEVI